MNKETIIDFINCEQECQHKVVCPVHYEFESITELTQQIAEGIKIKPGNKLSFHVVCLNYAKEE